MRKTSLVFSIWFAVSCGGNDVTVDLDKYYAPTVYSSLEYFSISIPVEIAEKNGKLSFVKLFEKYGFSGNGQAIEQVVRKNIGGNVGEYDSEADAFYINAKDSSEYTELLTKIKCIEEIACLNKWLQNATSIIIKE
ncbi:hypothetical protein [Aurantivibrio infirmus]